MSTAELLHKPPLRRTRPISPPPSRRASEARETEAERPGWARPALFALLALTLLAYVWDLSASGYANSFYAAAVQAGTKSWKAFFFGSLDSSNFITVDKPPASLWVMALSGRIFGFSSWSLLIPQALEGVAAVALLHASVRRWFGDAAALIAGAVFALTPVAALMFRFDNPDALLVLMLVASAYCLVRALEAGSTRWMLAVGTLLGFAFLAKMAQAFLVLPAFAAVYLIAAPTSLRRRLGGLLAGGAALLVSAGWWVAIVSLWPASSRPYIDGSSKNSILDLITGYNGLGRIFGSSGPGGGGGGGGNFSGATGPLRLFDSLMGGQASWLLPAALIALAGGLWASRRAPRTDRTRAALLLWGGWLLVTAAVFSFGRGVIHTYYTVALAPAIGALLGIGAVLAWRRREHMAPRAVAAAAVAGSAVWAYVLLARTPSFEPWVRFVVLPMGLLAAAGLLVAPQLGRRLASVAVVLACVASLAGPLAYTLDTISTAENGSVVSAGPAVAQSGFGGGPGGAAGGSGGPGGARSGSGSGGPPSGSSSAPSGSTGTQPPSGAGGSSAPALFGSTSTSSAGTGSSGGTGKATSSAAVGAANGQMRGGAGSGGGAGGGAESVSKALAKALEDGASGYRWVAATSGSQSAAGLELASGQAVMGIGGFNNQGGNLTLAQFEAYVKAGEIHYWIGGTSGGGMGGGPGGAGGSSQIAEWVASHYEKVTLGGTTAYDLSKPLS